MLVTFQSEIEIHLLMKSGQLVFLGATNDSFSDAIATTGGDIRIDHVGIISGDDCAYVIEARPHFGVVATPLDSFIARGNGYMVSGENLSSDIRLQAVARANKFLGLPYNQLFACIRIGDVVDSLYCSQLIYHCYLDSASRPIFMQSAMNFLLTSGEVHPFWKAYFLKLNAEIPQGIPGTSPQSILHQSYEL